MLQILQYVRPKLQMYTGQTPCQLPTCTYSQKKKNLLGTMSGIGTGATGQQYSRCIKFSIYANLKCGVLHSDLVNMWAMMSVSRVVRDTLMAQ